MAGHVDAQPDRQLRAVLHPASQRIEDLATLVDREADHQRALLGGSEQPTQDYAGVSRAAGRVRAAGHQLDGLKARLSPGRDLLHKDRRVLWPKTVGQQSAELRGPRLVE